MTKKIYLIRHGETTGDIEDRYGGDYDDHLSEKGKQQCKELAKKLKDKNIQMVYYSPRIRARETAEILKNILGIKIEPAEDIRERNNYGILTGLIKAEAKQKYPHEVEKLKNKFEHSVTNSEDYVSFKERVILAFKKIISSDYDVIAIILHGGPIGCIFREVLKLGEFESLGDCAVLELENINGKPKLVRLENAFLKR